MPFTSLPSLPYSDKELRKLCQYVNTGVPTLVVGAYSIILYSICPAQVESDWSIVAHEHSTYEAHLVLQGQAVYPHDGTQLLHPGSLVLHAPHTVHSWKAATTPFLRLIFWFSVEPHLRVTIPFRRHVKSYHKHAGTLLCCWMRSQGGSTAGESVRWHI